MYTETHPEPFGWLFRCWFNRLARVKNAEATSPLASEHDAVGHSNPLPEGQIQSPFPPVGDSQFENLTNDYFNNLNKALDAIEKDCKLTRLCSYLCASDRATDETMKQAFQRFRD